MTDSTRMWVGLSAAAVVLAAAVVVALGAENDVPSTVCVRNAGHETVATLSELAVTLVARVEAADACGVVRLRPGYNHLTASRRLGVQVRALAAARPLRFGLDDAGVLVFGSGSLRPLALAYVRHDAIDATHGPHWHLVRLQTA